MAVGYETWHRKGCSTYFKVKNTAKGTKRIRIFKYPIKNGMVRDLMEIPYVSEADIKHSLLKGELYIKILAKEIEIVESSIDLLQFDECHKQFLMDAGLNPPIGLEIGRDNISADLDGDISGGGGGGGAQLEYLWRHEVELIGPKNNANRNFMTPEKFLNGSHFGNDFKIIVKHNGRRLIQNTDFVVQESGGVGTGYDTVSLLYLSPHFNSGLIADYAIES